MVKNVLFAHGAVGVSVKLNVAELIVIKGFVDSVKYHTENPDKRNFDGMFEMVRSAGQFFTNILPEDVMSTEAAWENLFGEPKKEVKAENEL